MRGEPMGAWGIRTFENDHAADWIDDFAAQPDPGRLRAALTATADADSESVALAAAEIVAAWCGRPAPEMPRSVTAWLLGRTEAVTQEILAAARASVDAILSGSELRRLWEEAGELEAWSGAVEELRERLGE